MTTARLILDDALLQGLLRELAERGQGRRESGAFLLTDRAHPADGLPQPVTATAFYDDLDPACLAGAIDFGAAGYSALNALCRADARRVIADIHTHPYRHVRQSAIDAAHPMVAVDGHVALIAPHYAVGVTDVAQLGVHVRNDGHWLSFYGDEATVVVVVRAHRPIVARAPWWRRLLLRLCPHRSQENR
jgi:hypothetical protein